MAVAPQPTALEVVELRRLRPRALAALFTEEEREWRERLHWDYRPSVEVLRRHLDSRALPGFAALWQGEVAGYCFYVHEDDKGLIGDAYVRAAFRPATGISRSLGAPGVASLLLDRALNALENDSSLRRIEAQLIPFSLEPLPPLFHARGFASFPRLFLYLALKPRPAPALASEPPPLPAGVALQTWQDRWFEDMAELIVATYRDHVDSRINDHYSTPAGALRFLKNIVLFPGCGIFQPESSVVAIDANRRLLAAVLSSQVARGVGHITQLCVHPDWQRRGLGHRLTIEALRRLAARGCRGVSLTVTTENPAVRLYRRLGFHTLLEFTAFARSLAPAWG